MCATFDALSPVNAGVRESVVDISYQRRHPAMGP